MKSVLDLIQASPGNTPLVTIALSCDQDRHLEALQRKVSASKKLDRSAPIQIANGWADDRVKDSISGPCPGLLWGRNGYRNISFPCYARKSIIETR